MKHSKHKAHPHDKIAAMPQFNEGHWQKNMADTEVADGKYSSEFGQAEEYKKSVDGLANYAKRHREKH